MTSSAALVPAVPGPRQALDEGSVHDLAVDGAQVLLPAPSPRPLHVAHPATAPVLVPEDATAMLSGLSQYGS
ncbi:hypothetical protein GCM10027446_12050 [Angustibacter peucedani]